MHPRRLSLLLYVWPFICPILHAESICSENAVRKISEQIELFDRKDFLSTSGDLCPVIESEPQCAEALWVQSFVDFCLLRLRQYSEADYLKQPEMKWRALRLNPSLGQTFAQQGTLDLPDMQTQAFDHFDIRIFSAEDRSSAWEANGYLSDIYNELGSAFGAFPSQRFVVILYSPDVIFKHWHDVSQGGFFNLSDGSIRLRLGENTEGEMGLRFLCRREYAHAFLAQLHLKGLPGWFREGAAEFYGHRNTSRGFWEEDQLGHIREHFKSYARSGPRELQSLDKMETLYLNKKIVTTLGKYEAYLQAEAMVLAIAKDRGDSWIPSVIQRMQGGSTWNDAYMEVVGIAPETILERFHKSWKPAGDM